MGCQLAKSDQTGLTASVLAVRVARILVRRWKASKLLVDICRWCPCSACTVPALGMAVTLLEQ